MANVENLDEIVKEEDSILNIQYHTKRIILKALNNTKTKRKAAELLGITERTMYRWIEYYNINFDKENENYYELIK